MTAAAAAAAPGTAHALSQPPLLPVPRTPAQTPACTHAARLRTRPQVFLATHKGKPMQCVRLLREFSLDPQPRGGEQPQQSDGEADGEGCVDTQMAGA